MTQTAPTCPPPERPPSDIPEHPSDILVELIIGFLAPMFLFGANADISHARLAAIETLNAYRLETQADLIAVAQIVAFGLAALASLSTSLEDDIPIPLALRLRGNANACTRSAEQNRRALKTHRPVATETRPPTAPSQPPAKTARQAQPPAQTTTQPQHPAAPPAQVPPPIRPPLAPPAALAWRDDQIDAAIAALLRGTPSQDPPAPPFTARYRPPPAHPQPPPNPRSASS